LSFELGAGGSAQTPAVAQINAMEEIQYFMDPS
jgi:hypothetical protein